MNSFTQALVVASTLLSIVPAANAQGQPVNRNSRSSGLILRELIAGSTTASGGAPLITVYGGPGSTYGLLSQFGLTATLYDQTSLVAGAVGPLGLTAPTVTNLAAFVDPAGGTVGTIPASGFQNLNMNPAVPLPFGLSYAAMELQAMVFRPGGTVELSNT